MQTMTKADAIARIAARNTLLHEVRQWQLANINFDVNCSMTAFVVIHVGTGMSCAVVSSTERDGYFVVKTTKERFPTLTEALDEAREEIQSRRSPVVEQYPIDVWASIHPAVPVRR